MGFWRWVGAFGLTVGFALGGCVRADLGTNEKGEAPLDCSRPRSGCPCENPGEALDCGSLIERGVEVATCAMGTMTCLEEGTFSDCSADRKAVVVVGGPGERKTETLGTTGVCDPTFDVCDPYCYITTDTPGGFAAGAGFSNTTSGLTLVGTYTPQCTSLTLTPSASTVTLSGSSMSTLTSSPITFTLTESPSGCVASPFLTTWTVDRFDRATITGTDNTNGSLSVAVPIAGTIAVTAYAAGKSATTNITVKVNVLEAPTTDGVASPNQAASSTQRAAFGTVSSPNAGSGSSSATWLYPYSNTYLPLGLPAPVGQYRYVLSAGDSASAASAVKLSIRYPTGATATGAAFNYSLVVEESNSVTCAQYPSRCNFLDPQITIPQTAWKYFEQTARGQNAEIIVQRLRAVSSGSPVLETETRLPIHFVDGQLKGTVFYNSYTSPQAGNTGAILSIQPGATSPTLAVQPSGTCSTCHSINDQGTRLITNGGKNSGGSYSYDISPRFDMTTAGPSPTVLNSYTDNRYTFGGPWLDGTYYMTHGGGAEWHSPSTKMGFYNVSNSSTAVSVTNLPNDIGGYTPRFSPDGEKFAFTFNNGTNLPCSSTAVSPCSGTPRKLAANSSMTRMVVMDFSCSSPPCTSASSGFSVSNARDVTPGVTDRVAWPTFSPDAAIVAYQRQLRSSKSVLSWAASDVGTIAGAQSEIWASNVTTDGTTSSTPTRLNALNGLSSGGATYLPQRSRTVVNDSYPLYRYRINRHEMSEVGTAGPDVYLTGVPTGSWDLRFDMTVGGSRGTAKFKVSTNGGSSYGSEYTTAATVGIGNGLTANFPTGTYSNATVYKAMTRLVGIGGTPATSNQDVRIKIVGTGNRGTATFQYSTNGGSTWSGTLTTAATVELGSTGLIATFGTANYESTSWVWGALVTHYHEDGAQYSLLESDSCSNNATMTNTYDYRTNYLPSFAPSLVGGKSWVLFTSRRMYGNVAVQDGWDPEPNQSCSAVDVPTKKLWIAAVDASMTPGTDPSYPAFYLPGQETAAGNSDGYWVGTACTAVDGSCDTDDDCCAGTGVGATNQCRVISTATFPPSKACKTRNSCSASGQSCTATSDCCTGLVCPTGGGLCYEAPPLLFETQTYSREYVADCPVGTTAAWRFFEWQATIPSGTSIEFFSQTREDSLAAWTPAVSLATGTASASSAANQWLRGPLPTSSLFEAANVEGRNRLLVTMIFHPNSGGTLAPTMKNWRQIYDCLPSE